MNTNKEFPKYTENQYKGDAGQDAFSKTFTRFCLVNSCRRDVGIDFLCFLREGEYIKGKLFGVQLKSTEMEINDSKSSFSIQIKVTTINFWLEQVFPVFLVVYHIPSETFFWCYPQDQFPEGTLESKLQSKKKSNSKKKSKSNPQRSIRVDILTPFSQNTEIPSDLLKAIKDKGFHEELSKLQKKYEELLEDNTLDYKEQLEYEKYGREEEYWADIILEDSKIERHN